MITFLETEQIAERYGLKVQMHPEEKKLFDYAPVSGEMWGLPFKNYEGEIIYIDEGDRISIGDDELEYLFHSRPFSRQY